MYFTFLERAPDARPGSSRGKAKGQRLDLLRGVAVFLTITGEQVPNFSPSRPSQSASVDPVIEVLTQNVIHVVRNAVEIA